jgi:hypothetical protein
MTEQEYETTAAAIALAIWETSTGNGHDLARDDWDCHLQNCHAAVANSYTNNITVGAWHKAALGKVI